MNSSVSELSRRLENALDANYNITDISTVLDVVSILENSKITIEELRTSQLTKFINELRRRTSNEPLARRSKNLIRRWRSLLPVMLPVVPPTPPNGKVSARHNGIATMSSSSEVVEKSEEPGRNRKKRRKHLPEKDREDSQQQQHLLFPEVSNHHHHFRTEDTASKMQYNDLTFSGKFARMSSPPLSPTITPRPELPPDTMTPSYSQDATPTPAEKATKRRGRKKGSRGLSSLIGGDAYDTSPYLEFRKKLVSGPKKVKTTKELLADLQNRKLGVVSSGTSSPVLQTRPPSPATATLHSDGTQSHDTFTDQQLQSEEMEGCSRYSATAAEEDTKVAFVKLEPMTDSEEQLRELGRKLVQIIEAQQQQGIHEEEEEDAEMSGCCSCTFTEIKEETDQRTVVAKMAVTNEDTLNFCGKKPLVKSIFDLDEIDDVMSVKEMDDSTLELKHPEVPVDGASFQKWRCLEDPQCPGRRVHDEVTPEKVQLLHSVHLDHINGNWSLQHGDKTQVLADGGLYERVVPQYNHLIQDYIPKSSNKTHQRFGTKSHRPWITDIHDSDDQNQLSDVEEEEEEQVMEDDSKKVFREWHETVQKKSYNDEVLTILPYVVID